MYKQLTMLELWDILSEDIPEEMKRTFLKPDFPTRRWGQITTKTATTDKKALEKVKAKFEKAKITKDKEASIKFKSNLYKIEVWIQ